MAQLRLKATPIAIRAIYRGSVPFGCGLGSPRRALAYTYACACGAARPCDRWIEGASVSCTYLKVREKELSKVEAGLKKTKGSLHGNPPRFEEYLADGSSSSSSSSSADSEVAARITAVAQDTQVPGAGEGDSFVSASGVKSVHAGAGVLTPSRGVPAFNLFEAEEDPELRASQAALDELENLTSSGVKMHYTKRQRLEKK